MEGAPILTALYTIGYQTPEYSEGWGCWQHLENVPPYQHHPDQFLPNGERDIASVVMPVIGPYDSADPALVEYHILLAKVAGLDSFIIDGFDISRIDEILTVFFRLAENLQFKLALRLSEKELRSLTQANQAPGLNRLQKYFTLPAYLRYQGKALLCLKHEGNMSSPPRLEASALETIRTRFKEDILFVQNYRPEDKIVFQEWDSVYPDVSIYSEEQNTDDFFWSQCASAIGHGRFQFISGLVSPGLDDRGYLLTQEPRVISRHQGEKYITIWEENLKHHPAFIQISSWNNHREGSAIEPVKETILHKHAAVPGWGYRELLTTREYAVRFLQRKLWPLPALFLPERLYRLRKSPSPGTRGDRIRLYLLEGDITGAALGLEQAGV